MTEEKATPRNPLAEAYQNLLDLPKAFRDEICDECGWSEATFYRHKNKRKPFPKTEIMAIARKLELLAKDLLKAAKRKN